MQGLYSSDHNQVLAFDRPVGAVAIDPHFYRSGSGRRFVTGIDKVIPPFLQLCTLHCSLGTFAAAYGPTKRVCGRLSSN